MAERHHRAADQGQPAERRERGDVGPVELGFAVEPGLRLEAVHGPDRAAEQHDDLAAAEGRVALRQHGARRQDEPAADAVYDDAKRLGTTLQVPDRLWPPDRVAFDEYWKRSLDELRIDPPVREHLHGVAALVFLPWPLRVLAGPFNLFATTGFLAPEFRAMMRLDWSEAQQRRFDWLLTALRLADRVIPHWVWMLGYRSYLSGMRFRARRGWTIV